MKPFAVIDTAAVLIACAGWFLFSKSGLFGLFALLLFPAGFCASLTVLLLCTTLRCHPALRLVWSITPLAWPLGSLFAAGPNPASGYWFTYGYTAGAVIGVVAYAGMLSYRWLRSNSSSKPKPLRGSA
jgi:hypothetical protein